MLTRPKTPIFRWPAMALVVALCVAGVITLIWSLQPATPSDAYALSPAACGPTLSTASGFVGSQTCRSCHEQAYATWHRSYHRTMTQRASPQAVVAPFDGEQLQFNGQTYQLSREGDRYFVTVRPLGQAPLGQSPQTDSPAAAMPDSRRQVVMTTGSHHIQVYWICETATNMLIEFPFYYHIADARWMLRDHTMLHPPGQPQWPSIWNDRCIKCHSVNGVPGRDEHAQAYTTRVAELGIACEACHGPGREHVDRFRSPADRSVDQADYTGIVNPRKLASHTATQICARCHSASTPHDQQQFLSAGIAFQPGDDLHEFIRLNAFDPTRERSADEGLFTRFIEDYTTDGYWPDGTCRVGGDEYNALIESKCYSRGHLSCLSCHSMHSGTRSDQLSDIGLDNRACTQCHAEPRFNEQLSRHTHHAEATAGSSCYNCHMPHTSYALLRGMRSHRIDSPSVRQSVEFNRPNACNLCHLDRTLGWTAEHLDQWYGIEPAELNTDQQNVAASILWLLQGNAALRMIVAWHLGWAPAVEASGDDWQGEFLAIAMDDPYAAIRNVSFKSLQQLPGFDQIRFAYDAPQADRSRTLDQVRSAAKQQKLPAAAIRPALLQDATGNLMTDTLHQLLQNRDHRPVSIAE